MNIHTRSLNTLPYPSQISTKAEQKTHTTILKIADRFLVPIDDELVRKLGIKNGDIVSGMIDEAGRLIFEKIISKGTQEQE